MPLAPRVARRGSRRSGCAALSFGLEAQMQVRPVEGVHERCAAARGTAGRRCRRASPRRPSPSAPRPARSPSACAQRRRAGDIRGGNRGPIARRNAPRRWRAARHRRRQQRDEIRRRASRSGETIEQLSARRPRQRASVSRLLVVGRWRNSACGGDADMRHLLTWSRISAISGETTTVSRHRTSAGSW